MSEHTGDARQGNNRKSRKLKMLLLVIGVFLLLILFLPFLLAKPLKSFALGAVDIPGRVTADSLTLSWFNHPAVDGLALDDPEGSPVLQAQRIEIPDTGLLALLFGSRNLGTIRVVKPRVTLEQGPDGRTNLERALGGKKAPAGESKPAPPKPSEPVKVPSDLTLKLILEQPQLTYKAPDLAPINAEASRFEIRLSVADGAAALIDTTVSQGGQAGILGVDLAVADLFDQQGLLTLEKSRITGKALAKDLPVQAVDRIASLEGKLLAALGPRLDLEFETRLQQQGAKAVGPVTLKVDAPRMKGGFKGSITADGLVSEEENLFHLTVFPELMPLPEGDSPDPLPLPELIGPAELTVTLKALSLPTGDLSKSGFELNVRAAQINTRTRAPDYQLNFSELVFAMLKNPEKRHAILQLNSQMTSKATGTTKVNQGSLSIMGRINDFATENPVSQVQSQIKAKGLPLGFVDGFMELDGLMTDLAGDIVDLDLIGIFYTDGTGEFMAEAASPLAKVSFPARLEKNLTLQRQSDSAFAMTPKFSKRVVEKILPMIGIVTSAKPVEISMQADGFKVPVKDFIFEDIDLLARLSLGQVVLDDQAPLFQLLRSFPGVSLPESYTANFKTFDVGLSKGVVSFQRIKLKTSGLEFNFDGNVDLGKGLVGIDMRLPGSTLVALIPKLEGLVDAGDSFAIPVGGPLDSPRFDKSGFLKELKPLLIKAGARSLLGNDSAPSGLLGLLLNKSKQKQEASKGDKKEQKQEDDGGP